MATAKTQEPSSSPSTYHVFLSFRGGDTRKNFTDHLYTALVRSGIKTFRDDDEIRRGEDIELEINKAIRESKMSVIVLSKDYASSRWCLDELAMIMERKKLVGHGVLPVFYDVEQSHVREQKESLAEAFVRHEKSFAKEMDKVEGWRAALREVADLEEGMVLQDGYESQFIQKIVREVGKKLNRTVLSVAPYLVGVDYRIGDINLWLQDGSNEVGIATIYGVGGIGKTTIAKIVYNQNYAKFEGRSFLANVRETSKQHNGLVRLQRQLLSDLLKGKTNKIYNEDEGIMKIKDAICRKRTLLVLDDVDRMDQFNAIIGMHKWLYPGSKIIITTRHERLLRTDEVSVMFNVEKLDDKEALQLFSWHAFGQDHPIEVFTEHSKSAVHLCDGLPLALQVLGSSLSGRSIDVWNSALQKLEAIPDCKVQEILRVSYDSLQDDHDQNLFLDIACFFIGMEKDYVVSILDGCGFYTVVGISNLIDRCLITIDRENKLMMHQLVRDMGREVVRQESPEYPGKRSRLWRQKDAFAVLRENTGTDTVKGFALNLQMLNEHKSHDQPVIPSQGNYSKKRRLSLFSRQAISFDDMGIKTKAFAKMDRLKLLQLSYVKLSGDCGDFSKGLVWLFWRGFPFESIPTNFYLEKLIVLDMRNSSLRNIWKGTKFLPKLKILNLSHSPGLFRTPDFTGLPSLEILKLKDCKNLIEVDESVGNLPKLFLLNLKDCKSLKRLPEKIVSLESLEELILSGCTKLDQLPMEVGKMQSLRMLRADGTAIKQFNSLGDVLKLNLLSSESRHSIFWSWVSPVVKGPDYNNFPPSFLPSSLVVLTLSDCHLTDTAIPNELSGLPFLEYLDLSGNSIQSLPESINSLTMLQNLLLEKCTRLQSLPELPASLVELKANNCESLERITNLPNLLRSLYVEFFDCDKLFEVQGIYKLEPIRNIDPKLLNMMGWFNLDLESLGSIELEMFNVLSYAERKAPLQVLHECGICSIFLPGSEIPYWFSLQKEGFSVSFEVAPPVGHKICGMNICVVYTCDDTEFGYRHYVKIHNEAKGLKWTYSPNFFGIPNVDEDMLWLLHWKFGDDQLESGDRVNVLVAMAPCFQVKKAGVHLLYQQERQEKGSQTISAEIVQSSSPQYQNFYGVDVSAYQLQPSAYFLCNHNFEVFREIAEDGWQSVYDHIFDENHAPDR